MQEEKLKKGNNKILLISIIAVIAVLFLSASVYLVLRAKRDGSQFKEEVKGEVVIPDKNEEEGDVSLEDPETEVKSCDSYRVFDFNYNNYGSVVLTGTVITKVENAAWVEDEKVTNVYFVVSKLEIEDENQQLFYNYYMKKVKNGNTINDVDGENLLFKLGSLVEGELITTSEMSDNLKNKLLLIVDISEKINLGLIIPEYKNGSGVPDHFSFACEIMDEESLIQKKVDEQYNNDYGWDRAVLREETWPKDEADKINTTEGYVLVTSVISNKGDKVAYFESNSFGKMNIAVLDLNTLKSEIISERELGSGCVIYDYLPVAWSVNDKKIILEYLYMGGGCSVSRPPVNKIIDLETFGEYFLADISPIFINDNKEVIYIESAEELCGPGLISNHIIKKNVESGEVEVLLANKNEEYLDISLDEDGNLLYSYFDMVLDEDKGCYKLINRDNQNSGVLELK